MKLTIQRADLARVLTAVSKVVESRNTIPILSNVLLRADSGTLMARGTDLDLEVSAQTQCEVATSGATTVEAKRLADIAAKLPKDAVVSMETTGGSMIVKAGRSRFSLPTLPERDFPDLAGSVGAQFTVEFQADLAAMFAPVAFAISTEETRYYLNGVYLHELDGKLRGVATDGHRLASFEQPLPEGAAGIPGVIVPTKAIQLWPKGTATVSVSSTKIQVSAPTGTVLTSKLIDGTFPDYMRVVPRQNSKTVKIDRRALAEAVARVSVVSSDRSRTICLSLSEGGIALAVRDEGGGLAEDALDADYGDDALEVGFNSTYLADVLTALPSDTATLHLEDGGSPALVGEPGADWFAVLMPMRV